MRFKSKQIDKDCRNRIPSAAEAAYGTRIDPEKFFCSKQFLPKLSSPYPYCFCCVSASNPAPKQPTILPKFAQCFHCKRAAVLPIFGSSFCPLFPLKNSHKSVPNQPLVLPKNLDKIGTKTSHKET